jgi:hypothetical protein
VSPKRTLPPNARAYRVIHDYLGSVRYVLDLTTHEIVQYLAHQEITSYENNCGQRVAWHVAAVLSITQVERVDDGVELFSRFLRAPVAKSLLASFDDN